MDDTITITFGGKEYTGRRLTADQITAMRSVRDDAALMLDVMEAMAVYAFGQEERNRHIVEQAAGKSTVEGFIKLMVKFMEASLEVPAEDVSAAPVV